MNENVRSTEQKEGMSPTFRPTNFQEIKPDMIVYSKAGRGASSTEGRQVGSVDHLDGERYIKLNKRDASDGSHHWIPCSWVERIEEDSLYLNKTEEEFRAESFDSFPGEPDTETPQRPL